MEYRSGPRGQVVKEAEPSGDLDEERAHRLATTAQRSPVLRMLGDSVHVRTRTTVRPATAATG
ncbi:hypothetical protein [Streptomyces sp. NPDC058335]|uniref:hypothetical protein n=1 Tax=Streptomyces sp. NPDC058335 TaxID=3346451 RepID=UPI00365A58BA